MGSKRWGRQVVVGTGGGAGAYRGKGREAGTSKEGQAARGDMAHGGGQVAGRKGAVEQGAGV